MHPPVCVAAGIAMLWLSLSFVIPGCKALPLPTDQQDLPRTEQEWVNRLDEEDWKAGGWNRPVGDWRKYDPALFCGSPFVSNPSIHSGSPSGGPPAALDCQPAKSPIKASSHDVHLEAPPTTHQVASPIHGESYKDPNTASSSTHNGQNLPSGRTTWPDYDLNLFCGSPFDSHPSIHSGSPSGRPPTALDCQPSKSPIEATSHGVHSKTPSTTHQVASPIHGELFKDPDPNTSSSSPHTGNLGSQPPDTDPVQITNKVLSEKWLRYLSHHAIEYATFLKEYQENLQKKRQALSKNRGTEKELAQKIEKYQLRVYTRHRYEGQLRMEKLNGAIPDVTKTKLEEWERLGGDDHKDSKLQKAMKEEEAKIQAQAIALDPLKPKELNPEVMAKLMLIFRMERKEKIMTPDSTSEWARYKPEKRLVPPEDLDIFLEHPKYNEEKKEWIEKWRLRGESAKSTDAMNKLRNRLTEEGREAEIPEALADYKEEAWIQGIRNRRSAWVTWQKVRKGVKGYPKATRERINKWEIDRGDHDKVHGPSRFIQSLAHWRQEHEKKGVSSQVELDNLLWLDRGKRMTKMVLGSVSRKRKHGEQEAILPKLENFGPELEAQWLGRTDRQSLELSRLAEASKPQSHD